MKDFIMVQIKDRATGGVKGTVSSEKFKEALRIPELSKRSLSDIVNDFNKKSKNIEAEVILNADLNENSKLVKFIKEEIRILHKANLLEENNQHPMKTVDIKGVDKLKTAFLEAKNKNMDFLFGYGDNEFPVKNVEDNYLIITKRGKEEMFPYNYLTDEWGEIFYFLIKKNNAELMINFDFSDEEKEKFPYRETPEQLAQQDFEDIASPDEQEMYEAVVSESYKKRLRELFEYKIRTD